MIKRTEKGTIVETKGDYKSDISPTLKCFTVEGSSPPKVLKRQFMPKEWNRNYDVSSR